MKVLLEAENSAHGCAVTRQPHVHMQMHVPSHKSSHLGINSTANWTNFSIDRRLQPIKDLSGMMN